MNNIYIDNIMSVNSENSIININPYDNNKYELMYITLNGVVNTVKKDVWLKQSKFNATGSNVTDLKTLLKISKITQINTGEFVYLGNNCNVYKVSSTFTNPTLLSDKKYTGITQLSNYKILLTSKEGKMFTVDDINNFDQTISSKAFLDDGTIYSSVKQTFDGYVVAIDGTQCGNAWRFDLKKNELLNKTKLNLDDGIPNRVTLFLPSKTSLFNINCDSRYKDRLLKYDFSDKTIKTKYDLRCDEDEEYADVPFKGKSCYKKCPSGYSSIKDDYTSCWEKCGDNYKLIGGICQLQESTTYDRGIGIAPSIGCDPIKTTKCKWDIKKCPFGSKTTGGGNCKSTCKSNRYLQAGLCYIPCRSGYKGAVTICSNTKEWSLIPKTTPYKYVGKSGSPSPITCNSDCCMFDLTFYNPLYLKPTNLPVLPNLAVKDGLVGYYDATSFANGIWYDLSSKSNNAVYIKGGFKNNGTFISGTPTSSILFPTQILPSQYTVFNIGRYSGSSKGKILSGYYNNWFSGFNAGLSGVSGRDNPITQTTLSAFDNNWVFSTDINSTYRANGNNYTTKTISPTNASAQLSINLNDKPTDNSDFSIGCVIVFNRVLFDDEILAMESWLTSKYSDLWAGTYKKTLAQGGYSCFNNKVGKVTNNYNSYTYASYKKGTIGCEWLNLPEKNNFNPLTCTSVESESYETFNNLIYSDSFFPDYLFYLLVIILLIIVIIKRCNKD